MTFSRIVAGALLGLAFGGGFASAQAQTDPVTITVEPGARQAFAGFGASFGNWGGDYQKLTPAERTALSRAFWHDLKFHTLRLWLNTDQYAPTPGAHDLSVFRRCYVDSGLIADARKQGMTTLLLTPDYMPPFMENGERRKGQLKDEAIPAYADLIAEFLQRLRRETGVSVDATGVQNEPNDEDRIAPEQMAAVIKALRAALDRRGLKRVQIIAPESANVDGVLYDTVDRLKADPAAWRALGGVASHSYNNATTPDIARRLDGTVKSYWMTEASDNGPEAPGDAVRAASLASRFLNDMNHRVTHWVHFLGFEVPDPNDNATRILAYTTGPLQITTFQKYAYYQQLSDAFDVGARFRQSVSDRDGGMTWTSGKKPGLTAAAAQNPDGSWAVGLSNFTAPQFSDADDEKDFGLHNSGHHARIYTVTVRIPELARVQALPFRVVRSGGQPAGQAVLKNGVLTVPDVGPLDLVTLRSEGQPR